MEEESPEAAALTPTYEFGKNEVEHVKFSYYDPFGDGSQFDVILCDQDFCYPYPGKFLSGYGMRGRSMHTGIDIKGAPNDTIRAAFSGVVRMSKMYSGYGNCVVLRHANGLETLYGHNSKNLVKVGDQVQVGEPIALMGRTGRATTEHCHFEVRIQGQHINPALLVDYHKHTLRDGTLTISKKSDRILAANPTSGVAPTPARAASEHSTALADNTPRSTPASSTTASGNSSASVYTVKKGDTLSGIAKRFGTTVTKICTQNNIDRNAILPLGKKLKVN